MRPANIRRRVKHCRNSIRRTKVPQIRLGSSAICCKSCFSHINIISAALCPLFDLCAARIAVRTLRRLAVPASIHTHDGPGHLVHARPISIIIVQSNVRAVESNVRRSAFGRTEEQSSASYYTYKTTWCPIMPTKYGKCFHFCRQSGSNLAKKWLSIRIIAENSSMRCVHGVRWSVRFTWQ